MFIQNKSPRITGVVYFTVLYILGFVALAVVQSNYEFLYYVGVLCVLATVIFIAHKCLSYNVKLLWFLSFWGLIHLAGGLLTVPESWPIEGDNHVLYSLWLIPDYLKYDHMVHFYGFAVTTWLSWQTLCSIIHSRFQRRLIPTLGLLIICATSSMGYGALNEVIEFVATLCLPETNVGGYDNTGWDLVANLLGATFATITIKLRNI